MIMIMSDETFGLSSRGGQPNRTQWVYVVGTHYIVLITESLRPTD